MKCKNTECQNETTGKRVYCSLTCRNIFVNKNLRNYDKVSDTFQQKKKEKEEKYLENPKKCLHCDSIISYDSRENNYCNHSCFASESNMKREVTWGDKIRNSIHKYLIENGIKEEGKIGIYDITCKGCGNIFQKDRNDLSYCSFECRRTFGRRNMSEYQKYRVDSNFKFSLKDYPNEFDFTLVERYGWYSPTNKKNNLNGVSRDHMFSVKEGFDKGIDPKIISHPANCRLMIHNDNISKNKKSVITIEELLERIKKFEEKYMKRDA
jgi:hypothetical protein